MKETPRVDLPARHLSWRQSTECSSATCRYPAWSQYNPAKLPERKTYIAISLAARNRLLSTNNRVVLGAQQVDVQQVAVATKQVAEQATETEQAIVAVVGCLAARSHLSVAADVRVVRALVTARVVDGLSSDWHGSGSGEQGSGRGRWGREDDVASHLVSRDGRGSGARGLRGGSIAPVLELGGSREGEGQGREDKGEEG